MSRCDFVVPRLSCFCRVFVLGRQMVYANRGASPEMRFQSRKETLCRTLIVIVVCALVFLFAYHAKTGVYGPSKAKVTPVTASKLWVSSQKMEPAPQSTAMVLWAAVLCFFALTMTPKPLLRHAVETPTPALLPSFEWHRFLRPPPVSL